MRQKRQYLQYCEKSLNALRSAIASFNSVYDPYKIETTLILLTNAWELFGKAILIRSQESILRSSKGQYSLSAEQIIYKLQDKKILDDNQAIHLQQVISLRNEIMHGVLPSVPIEVLHHLFYFSCKFFKDTMVQHFPRYKDVVAGNYLSIAFGDLTTYADKIQKLVSRYRKGSQNERRVVWLLERGIRFDGTSYISQDQFEKEFKEKAKWKLLPHLQIGKFIKNAEMVRIVAIQAPKNFTADIILRKGKQNDSSLPVVFKKTDIEKDYPYLTGELGLKLNKTGQFIGKMAKNLGIRNDSKYHQSVRSSKSGAIQRYTESAYLFLKNHLEKIPNYNPFR